MCKEEQDIMATDAITYSKAQCSLQAPQTAGLAKSFAEPATCYLRKQLQFNMQQKQAADAKHGKADNRHTFAFALPIVII